MLWLRLYDRNRAPKGSLLKHRLLKVFRKTTALSLLDLPTELHLIIIDMLCEEYDKDALSKLCLTNKYLLALAQPFLFREIDLTITFPYTRSRSQLNSLHHVLSTNKTLRGFIHCFRTYIEGPSVYLHPAQISWKTLIFTQLCTIMAWLPTLREFGMRHEYPSLSAWQWELTLKMLHQVPNLEKLDIFSSMTLCNSILLQELQKLSMLKSVKLHWKDTMFTVPVPGLIWRQPPGSWSLSTLRRLDCGFSTLNIMAVLPYCSALEDLTVPFGEIPIPLLQRTLTPVFSTLQTLTLVYRNGVRNLYPKIPFNDFIFIQELPQLTSLKITDWTIHPEHQPKDFSEIFLCGTSYELRWVYTEWTFAHEPFTRLLIPFMNDAFSYGNEGFQNSGVGDSDLELRLEEDSQNWDEINKELPILQAKLTDLGVNTSCHIVSIAL
jgi:hypothetical protein